MADDVLRGFLPVEFFGSREASLAEGGVEVFAEQDFLHRVKEVVGLIRIDENASAADHFRKRWGERRDDRDAGRHRLHGRQSEALEKRRVHKKAGEIVQRGFVAIVHEVGHNDAVAIRWLRDFPQYFLAFPPAHAGDDQRVFAEFRIARRLELIVGADDGHDVFARFDGA